jgi:hypothetical protein
LNSLPKIICAAVSPGQQLALLTHYFFLVVFNTFCFSHRITDGAFVGHDLTDAIRRAVDFPGANWIRSRVLCLTGWPNLDPVCGDRAPRGDFTYCAEMTALPGLN